MCGPSPWLLGRRIHQEHSPGTCSPWFGQTGTPLTPPCPQVRSTALHRVPGLSDHQMMEHVARSKPAGIPWKLLHRCPTHNRPHHWTQIYRGPLGCETHVPGRGCEVWCSLKLHPRSPSDHSVTLLSHSLRLGHSVCQSRWNRVSNWDSPFIPLYGTNLTSTLADSHIMATQQPATFRSYREKEPKIKSRKDEQVT